MATRQPVWDKYEAALLLEGLLDILQGNMSKTDVIEYVSINLRKLAQKRGVEIDDQYRNTNGISFQLQSMKSAYYGYTVSIPTTKLFTEVVTIYKNNPTEFSGILEEARAMIADEKAIENSFMQYLSTKVSPAQLSELYWCYSEIEAFCLKTKVLQSPLFQTTNYEVVKKVQRTVEQNKIFRITHRKQFNKILTAIRHYYTYIKEGRFPKGTESVFASDDTKSPTSSSVENSSTAVTVFNTTNISITRTEQDKKLLQKYPIIFKRVFTALQELSQNRKNGVSVNEIEVQINRIARSAVIEEILNSASWSSPVGDNYSFSVEVVDHWISFYKPEISTAAINSSTDKESIFTVDFNGVLDLAFTKPVSFSYFGDAMPCGNSWTELYVNFVSTMLEDYPNIFFAGMSFSKSNGRIELAEKADCDFMVAPKAIPNIDYMLETNVSASDMASKMKYILDLCNVDFENVVITYKKKVKTTLIDLSTTLHSKEAPTRAKTINSQAFAAYLENELHMAAATCRGYSSSINSCEVYAREHNFASWQLYTDELSVIKETSSLLLNDDEFLEYDRQQHHRFVAALKKFIEFCMGENAVAEISQGKVKKEKRKKKNEDFVEYKYQDAVTSVLIKHYSFGYRIESSIEMNRFRKYANIDEVVLPESDDELKREILNVGFLIGDKVYVIGEDTVLELKSFFENSIVKNNANVVFFENIMACYASVMEERHITSDEMLREIVIENEEQIFEKYKNIYIAKNFVSTLGKCTEREAVTKEMKRVWGTTQTMQIAVLAEALPCIPERYIAQYLSANRNFVWASDGVYMSVDKLLITQKEADAVYRFVLETCEKQGYAPLSDIPLGNMVEENYELSILSLLNAVYNMVLYDDFYLNGKILTKDNTGLDIVTLAKQYIEGKDECTFSEVNEKVSELSGTSYRYMAYEALYSTMVRIDEEHYVADKHVKFDVAAIDEILLKMIEDDFVAIKEISTFAVFPMCGQAWNHYLLESYCYRFSKRFSLKVLGFNDKNAGMIITKGVASDYEELLARAAARSKIELSPKNVGSFFFEVGYMGKRTFSALKSVTERAMEIREG